MAVKREKAIEKEVLAMCQEIGFDVDVIDSKATYSKNLDRYMPSQAAPVGFPDLVGNTRDGIAVFIELKAPGKLKTLRDEQRKLLRRKIEMGCFAVCVDSADLLFALYVRYKSEGGEFLLAVLDKI